MRLGFQTEDNKKKKPVSRKHVNLRLGFPTTSRAVSKAKPKVKPPKVVVHSDRLGFPTTPYIPKRKVKLGRKLRLKLKPPASCIVGDMKPPRGMVSIVILSYNTLKVTVNCIRSVLAKTIHPFELFVVDNASRDGSVNWLKTKPYLTLIANTRNIGFSRANNLAIRRARGRYVCLLNSDTVAQTRGWLSLMVKVAKSSRRIGTVGAKLLYQNGRIQHLGGGVHGRNPYHPYEKYPSSIRAAFVTRDVPYNTGACLLITKAALKKVGLLDEHYPFGFEDVDYGLRVVEKGLRNVVCHKAVLTHLWAYTQRKTGRGITTGSLARYHAKWDSKLPSLARKVTLDWGAPFCV